MDACNTGTSEQLRETSLARCRAERYAIQQDLIAGRSEQQTATAALFQSGFQFFPGGLELRTSTRMTEFV